MLSPNACQTLLQASHKRANTYPRPPCPSMDTIYKRYITSTVVLVQPVLKQTPQYLITQCEHSNTSSRLVSKRGYVCCVGWNVLESQDLCCSQSLSGCLTGFCSSQCDWIPVGLQLPMSSFCLLFCSWWNGRRRKAITIQRTLQLRQWPFRSATYSSAL